VTLNEWNKLIDVIKNPKGTIQIGVVGKYVQHQDAYKSIYEALSHGALQTGYNLVIKRFEADKLHDNGDIKDQIKGCDGYLVPGGFGERGWEGKISTAKYCRETKTPYFGICLGMQVLAVEFGRNVAKLAAANSTEIVPETPNPVISLLSEQKNVTELGGTMRLGAYECLLKEGSHAHRAYGASKISERHRHRYEFNNEYKEQFEKAGVTFAGTLSGGNLCEIMEINDHPWMVGVQFHPEFKSKPTEAHPLFLDFIKAAIAHKERNV
jgi:CTP synthase